MLKHILSVRCAEIETAKDCNDAWVKVENTAFVDGGITFFLDNFREEEVNDLETEANQLAAEQLKHQEIITYLKAKINYLSTTDIENCAKQLAIHPALIIGKLAFDKTISF